MVAIKVRQGGAWVDSTVSAKVRVSGAWVDYGPPAGGPESFFGTEVPANRDQADSAITLGLRFTPSTNMTATHARFRYPVNTPSLSVAVQGGIYRISDQALLGTTTFSLSPTLDDWNTAAYASGIALTSGVGYIAAIWTPGRYTYTSTYPWPVSTAHMVTDATSACRFTAGASMTFPTTSFNENNYFADLVATV